MLISQTWGPPSTGVVEKGKIPRSSQVSQPCLIGEPQDCPRKTKTALKKGCLRLTSVFRRYMHIKHQKVCIFNVFICFLCMFAHTTFVPGAHRGQVGSEFLEMDGCELVAENQTRSFTRAVSALDQSHLSFPQCLYDKSKTIHNYKCTHILLTEVMFSPTIISLLLASLNFLVSYF